MNHWHKAQSPVLAADLMALLSLAAVSCAIPGDVAEAAASTLEVTKGKETIVFSDLHWTSAQVQIGYICGVPVIPC